MCTLSIARGRWHCVVSVFGTSKQRVRWGARADAKRPPCLATDHSFVSPAEIGVLNGKLEQATENLREVERKVFEKDSTIATLQFQVKSLESNVDRMKADLSESKQSVQVLC